MTAEPTSTADSPLITKVRKLLAMAEGTPNANEADAFSRKAAELITEHRISPEQLRDGGSGALDVDEYVVGRGAYVRGRLALLQAVAEGHGCRVVFQAQPAGTVAFVAGFRSDLDAVGVLHHSLHAQASSRMAAERRATAAATQRWRRSFLFGFAAEIHTMLGDTVREATERLHPSSAALPVLRARESRSTSSPARGSAVWSPPAVRRRPPSPGSMPAAEPPPAPIWAARGVVGLRALGRGA